MGNGNHLRRSWRSTRPKARPGGGAPAGAAAWRRTGAVAVLGVLAPAAGLIASTPARAAANPPSWRLVEVAAAPQLPTRTVRLGAVAPAQLITGAIVLRPRDEAALSGFLDDVTDARSPLFHQYLSKGQFGSRFGATPDTIGAVTRLLTADGLHVSGVSANDLLVQFSGSAARLESAFHTGLVNYRFPDGAAGRGTTSAVRLPAPIAASLVTVVGLDDLLHSTSSLEHLTRHLRHSVAAETLPATPSAAPKACGGALGQGTFGGVTDDEVAHSYGVDGLYDADDFAAGQTVDVFELEPFATSDIATFDDCYFGVSHTSQITVKAIDGGAGTGPGSGEAVLDVEDVSALAPAAHIDVYEGPNTTFGSIDTYNAIAVADNARVVTTSWGLCESALAVGAPGTQEAENVIFEETAAQGQSVFAAAGDDGSDDCANQASSPIAPDLSVDDPGSQPYVTSVGGTSFLTTSEPPDEIVWNDGSNFGAGGGGVSDTWAQPAWQASASVDGTAVSGVTSAEPCSDDPTGALTSSYYNLPGLATTLPSGTACRLVPDVTALADEFTGITVYMAAAGGWTTFGGTSSSTPLWAAMTADVNASSFCSATAGAGVGFIGPLLYDVASSSPSDYADAFNDITVGDNDDLDVGPTGTTFPATTGYDLASGLGSPKITDGSSPGLAAQLCDLVTSANRPSVSGVAPTAGTSDGGTSVTISGSDFGSTRGSVYFGDEHATVVSWTAASIVVTTPAYDAPPGTIGPAAGPADVTVVTATPQASSAPGPAATFHYTAEGSSGKPVVDYLSPSGGTTSGGGTVDVIGSGFSSAITPTVTFGGVPGSVTVRSDSELQVVPPPLGGGTTCAHPSDPSVCQVDVVVTTSTGSSAASDILPAYSGPFQFQPSGLLVAPAGTETVPAPTEFDYAPAPTISSVSPSYGSETGGTPETLTGSGFDVLTYEWVTFGPPKQGASQDYAIDSISPDSLVVTAPPDPNLAGGTTTEPDAVAVGFTSIAGSAAAPPSGSRGSFSFAGIPTVSKLSTHVGSTAGGQTLTITGKGLVDADTVEFLAQDAGAWGASVTLQVSARSDTSLTITTPADLPIATDVLVCSETGCSAQNKGIDGFTYGYPGRPVIEHLKPSSGAAEGGTSVTITGQLLGNATEVLFGSRPATSFASVPESLSEFSDSYEIVAVAPAGVPRSTVDVRVFTVGGEAVGKAESVVSSADRFTYEPSPPSAPQDVTASLRHGGVTVGWKAPAQDGGYAVTRYELVASAKGEKAVRMSATSGTRSVQFGGLKTGITWTITVRAVNKLGVGLGAVVSLKV